ncbi:MAG: divergent polysaccharide deacetylase family protein [Desulfuromonadales bacterium]|nr:divergent polysaccharide deacetylase family protein [Desulfuromonadales bacterium]MDW7758642.1 divergent polysaccharide deacetylase family protein [Desulfuromonadales bacterium]
MAKQKKTPSKKTKRQKKRQQNNWPWLALTAFAAVVCLLLVLTLLPRILEKKTLPPTVTKAPSVLTEVLVEDIRIEVESALLRAGAKLPTQALKDLAPGATLTVEGAYPETAALDTLQKRLKRLSGNIEVQNHPGQRTIVILWAGRLLFAIEYPPEPPALPDAPAGPRVAIIIDDVGRDLATARKILDIDLPLNVAILPFSHKAVEVDQLLYQQGREILIHIPMEPQGYPEKNPGPQALFVNLDQDEIRRRFATYLQRVPHATGGNNHMGSRFTEEREGMRTVLDQMNKNSLFFVDSLTTPRSVAYAEAVKMGIPSIERDVFLDNVQDTSRILAEIRKLVALAHRQDTAVGICHPHPETLEALRQSVRIFQESGVTVVPVSQLLRP